MGHTINQFVHQCADYWVIGEKGRELLPGIHEYTWPYNPNKFVDVFGHSEGVGYLHQGIVTGYAYQDRAEAVRIAKKLYGDLPEEE